MSQPPVPKDERRAVPRHIRDAEHDLWRDVAAEIDGGAPRRRRRLWIALILALAVALAGCWIFLSRGG